MQRLPFRNIFIIKVVWLTLLLGCDSNLNVGVEKTAEQKEKEQQEIIQKQEVEYLQRELKTTPAIEKINSSIVDKAQENLARLTPEAQVIFLKGPTSLKSIVRPRYRLSRI